MDADGLSVSDEALLAESAESPVPPYKIYFAVPASWEGKYDTVSINAHRSSNHTDDWTFKQMTYTGQLCAGQRVYSVDISSMDDCQWKGFDTLQFQFFKNGAYQGKVEPFNKEWVRSSVFANQLYFGQTGSWVDAGAGLENLSSFNAFSVYYDARLSMLQVYKNEINNDTGAFPSTEQAESLSIPKWNTPYMFFYAVGSGKPNLCGVMEPVSSGSYVYKASLPSGYSQIVFSSFALNSLNEKFDSANGDHGARTDALSIDASYEGKCFYGDSHDPVIYTSNRRGGYWDTLSVLRCAGYPGGVGSGTRPLTTDIYYVNTTVYDYFSDYELNGNNRSRYPSSVSSPRHQYWVSFRHFDQALSDRYKSSGESIPLYVGHFQPKYSNWGYPYQDVAGILGLYGFHSDAQAGFMSSNNSTLDANGNGEYYNSAAQGLVSSTLGSGNTVLTRSGNILPFFDSGFLGGSNSKNTVLGTVYENAAFPFTKQIIDGVEYWSFDSADSSLALKYDSGESRYFFQNMGLQDWSRNTESGGTCSEGYGFFPFNAVIGSSANASKYNFGFGLKMDIKFFLPEDGKINGHDIKLNFSGDDDLWIFIDGKLILDVGGSHSSVSGSINFAEKTATVSSTKASQGGSTPSGFTISGGPYTEHTMTIFYMERGMWQSNLKLSFNFVDESQLNVNKTLDTSDVNADLFPVTLFTSHPFRFNIKNLVTHYGTVSQEAGAYMPQYDIPDYGSASSGTLQNAAGAKYSLSGGTASSGAVDTSGIFSLLPGETATFDNQFRRGSYIALNETLSTEEAALFETKWTMQGADGNNVTSFGTGTSVINASAPSMVAHGGTAVDDGRTENKFNYDDTQDGSSINAYKGGHAYHPENTFVFRSYSKPDATLGETELTVLYANKVKVGSLEIKKQQAAVSDPLTGPYTFNVVFSNVGGLDLEGTNDITTTVTVPLGGSAKIEGIPVGTEYTITEAVPEGTELLTIDGADVTAAAAPAASGSIAENQTDTHTFVNAKKPTVEASVNKVWLKADGTAGQAPVETISLRLEKSLNGTDWSAVTGYETVSLGTNGWAARFEKLDKYEDYKAAPLKPYRYRVVELGTENNYIFFADERYEVSYSQSDTETSFATTITNKHAPILYDLTISKTVTGNLGSRFKSFSFTLTLKDKNNLALADTSFTCEGAQTSITTDSDGKATFSLKNGQQLTIKGIPKGCAYTVEEEDLTASGYTTTVDGSEGLTASGTLNENAAHSFVNNKQTVIPTGVSMEPRSLLLMALGFTVLVLTSLSLRRMDRRGKRKA